MITEFQNNKRNADVRHLSAEEAAPEPTYSVGQHVRVRRNKGPGVNRDEADGQIVNAGIDDEEWYDVKIPDGPEHKKLTKVLKSTAID